MPIRKNVVINLSGDEKVSSDIYTNPASIALIVEMGSNDPDGSATPGIIVKTPAGLTALVSVDPDTNDVMIAYEGGTPK